MSANPWRPPGAEGETSNPTLRSAILNSRAGRALPARDILIAAMGSPAFVTAEMVKPGAVVVDVGVNRVPDSTTQSGTRLVGDVDFAGVQPIAAKITPNPGGVGPMTIALLMANTVRAAEQAGDAQAIHR